MKKKLFKIALVSMLAFVSVSWLLMFNGYGAHVTEGISFLALTWYFIAKYKETMGSFKIILALIVGRLFLEIVPRCFSFAESIGSLDLLFISFIGVVAGFLCAKYKNMYLRVVLIYFMIVIAFLGGDCWDYYVTQVWMPEVAYHGLLFRH